MLIYFSFCLLSLKRHRTRSVSPFRIVVCNFVFIPPITSQCVHELQRNYFDLFDSDQLTAWHLPSPSFNPPSLYGSRSVTSSYLLFTSTRRVCFRTWLLAKLVSVTKVVNENIDGYGFSPSPFMHIAVKIYLCLRTLFIPHRARNFSQAFVYV